MHGATEWLKENRGAEDGGNGVPVSRFYEL